MSTIVTGKFTFLDTPSVNSSLVLLNEGNTPSILSDITANKPAAGSNGRLFIDTTNNNIQRDDGILWNTIGGSFPYTLAKSTNIANVTGTIAETDIINFSVPAGTLLTDGIIQVRFGGTITNNSGANRTQRIRIYYGATLMYDDTSATLATSTRDRPFFGQLALQSANSTTAQTLTGLITIGGINAATTGFGDLGTATVGVLTPLNGSSAIDSALANNFRVTVTHSNVAATIITSVAFYTAIKI